MILIFSESATAEFNAGYSDSQNNCINWNLRFHNSDYRNGCAAAEAEQLPSIQCLCWSEAFQTNEQLAD